MSRVECNVEKSRMSFSSMISGWNSFKLPSVQWRKVTDTVKITFALQNVKGNFPRSLNVSVSNSISWSQVHSFLINYFNNPAAPTDPRGIYQFTSDKQEAVNVFKKRERQGQKPKAPPKKKSKGSSGGFSQKGKSQGKGKGQWTIGRGQCAAQTCFQKDNRKLGKKVSRHTAQTGTDNHKQLRTRRVFVRWIQNDCRLIGCFMGTARCIQPIFQEEEGL